MIIVEGIFCYSRNNRNDGKIPRSLEEKSFEKARQADSKRIEKEDKVFFIMKY